MYIYIYHYLPSTENVYCKVVIVIVDFYYQGLNQHWMNAVTNVLWEFLKKCKLLYYLLYCYGVL